MFEESIFQCRNNRQAIVDPFSNFRFFSKRFFEIILNVIAHF